MTEALYKKLIELEKLGVSFNRIGNNLSISTVGYATALHHQADAILRKQFKLKYDFDSGIEQYDKVCGKTFTYYKDVYKTKG